MTRKPKTSTSWPGSEPPTPREITKANRRLLVAMRRHKAAKQALARSEADLREAKAIVKGLLDLIARGTAAPDPGRDPFCPTCSEPRGSNPRCVDCQAVHVGRRPTLTPSPVDAGLPK